MVLKLFPSVSDLFAKEGVHVHVFTTFIFPSEQCEEIISNLG